MSDDRAVLAAELERIMTLGLCYYEWRHRILVRFAVALSGLSVATYFVYDARGWGPALLPLFGIGVVSLTSLSLDAVNGKLLDQLYERGSVIEGLIGAALPDDVRSALAEDTLGPFTMLAEPRKPSWLRYRVILRALYVLTPATTVLVACFLYFEGRS